MSFQERMLRGLQEFRGVSTIILSGNDYTAKEFMESERVFRGRQL